MIVSKSIFERNISHLKCNIINHPWNENCVCANLDMLYSSIVGVNKFYNLYYLIDLLLRRKQISKNYMKYLLKGLVQSTVFGVFIGNIFVMSNCIAKRLFGRWYYYNSIFTGTIAGLSIFFENPKRRGTSITSFMNWALELIVNQLRQSRLLKINKKHEMLFFMVCSAFFMYSLRTDPTYRKIGGPYVWFYNPPLFPYTGKENDKLPGEIGSDKIKVCPHEGSCWKDIINAGVKYFGFGISFKVLSIFLNHGSKMFKSPFFAGKAVFKIRNMYTGLFLACYLITYKAVSCTLCQYRGFDSPLHALPAGLLAGLAYYMEPNISILLTIISNLLIVGGRHLRNSQNLPKWPYGELVLALSFGLLYHYRFCNPECCPAYFIKMVELCTSGKSTLAHESLIEVLSKECN